MLPSSVPLITHLLKYMTSLKDKSPGASFSRSKFLPPSAEVPCLNKLHSCFPCPLATICPWAVALFLCVPIYSCLEQGFETAAILAQAGVAVECGAICKVIGGALQCSPWVSAPQGLEKLGEQQKLWALLKEENSENSVIDSGSLISEDWENGERFRSLTLLLKTS